MRLLTITILAFALSLNMQAQMPDSLKTKVDEIFTEFNNTNSPGCALAILQDGKMLYEKYYGMSNLEYNLAVSPDSKFHVASVSKQFTAAAIIKLSLEGKISLDDDIRKYIPEVPDFGYKITFYHLLHHTSGLRDQWEMMTLSGWRSNDLITETDILDMVKRQKSLNFKPGDEFLYSNTGFTLLAVAVKKITGVSLKDYTDSVFFKPMGMNNTHFQSDHSAIIPNRTSAYVKEEKGNWRIEIPVFDNYGATALFTTARDLAKWDEAFYGGKIFSDDFVQAMYKPGVLNDGTEQIYASGLMLENYNGYNIIEHGGADAGYRCFVLRIPEKHFSAIILSNSGNFSVDYHRIIDLFLTNKNVEKQRNPEEHFAIDSTIVKNWEGDYFDETSSSKFNLHFEKNELKIGWWGLNPVSNYDFSAGPMTTFSFKIDGKNIFMTKADIGAQKTVYKKVKKVEPAKVDGKQYIGNFYCSELDALYRVTGDGNNIFVHIPRNDSLRLTPYLNDVFEGDFEWIVRFKRDNKKQINGFYLSARMVRSLFFEKKEL
ncbi:MAG: beta-lactamase family protein [Bacteroidales bacterium]|nr:beta-lactamase family protein [Bacteroidales bacterium]